ncbi:hypothetical protein PFISCL1PPCAC_17112, partial [Pristionchus fissidentatus]
ASIMFGYCFCGCMRSSTGSKILAVIFIIGAIFWIGAASYSRNGYKDYETRIIFGVSGLIVLLASALVFPAIYRRCSGLMIPMLIILGINVLVFVVCFALAVYTIFVKRDTTIYGDITNALIAQARMIGIFIDKDLYKNLPYFLSAIYTFGLFISFWVYSVFYDCYKCILCKLNKKIINKNYCN